MRDRIVAIDQGTTGTRACVMDAEGRIVARAYRTHRQHHPREGWVEHDPAEIWAHTQAVIDEAVAGAGPDAARRVAAVGLANQGETVMLWDSRTGEPVHHALTWQDTRTQAWVDELARDPAVVALVEERTGLRLDPYFSAPKLRWLLDHAPGAREHLAAGALRAGTIDTWLLTRLTDGESFVTDPSTAARTLLFDLRAGRWDDELLARFGVPRELLAEVRPTVGPFGRIARGPLAGAPILASLVDQPAAMVGEGCLDAGALKATFGTGCFVYLNTGETPARAPGLLTTIAWARDGRTTYALDGGVFAAGSVLGWLRELGLVRDDADVDALVPQARGDEVVCVPALAGLAAPHWRRGARAAWLGMALATSRADLVRAAVEGVACRVVEVVRAMEGAAGTPVRALRADGGLTGCAALMQMVADLAGVPVELSAEPEATAAGAAALAARAAGLWTDDAPIHARVRTARIIAPRLSADAREARLRRFARAVEVVTRWGAEEAR